MAELIQWWNLVYVLAFFFALLYALLNAVGLATSGTDADVGMDHDVGDLGLDADAGVDVEAHVDFDHDVDVDVDAGVDLDHDVDVGVEADVGDVDAHVDVDHDVHVDVDHDVDVDHEVGVEAAHAEPSFLEEALSFFGIGKVPLSVILMTFLTTFAVVGWAVNTVLKVALPPVFFFPISCASALVCGLMGTKLLAGVLGRYLKPVETAAVRRAALVGRIATARLPISDSFGQATVVDQFGSRHKVVCKVRQGAEPIAKGQGVLLVRFVPDTRRARRTDGYYLVEPYEIPTRKSQDTERRE